MDKLISMTDFVFMLRNRTTSELCKDFPKSFTLPVYNGNKDDMVKKMLGIDAIQWKLTGEYAKFLKQPLTLGMFVTCDEDGNIYIDYHSHQPKEGTVYEPYQGLFEVSKKGKDIELLNEPQFWKEDQRYYNKRKYDEAFQKYQEAKQRVLFEGWNFSYDFPGTITIVNNDGIYLGLYKSDLKFRISDAKGGKLALTDIESFINKAKFEIILTESAKQQIGL